MRAGWRTQRLGDVATLQRGFDLPVQKRSAGKVPVFAANGPVGTHAEAKLGGPGVVTGRSGTIGKVHYVDGPYWPLNTSLFVKDFHGNDPKYVYWLLKSMRLEQFHSGTGVPTLNRNIVHELPVSIPPIDEQRRIARVLDAADALRAKRRQALAKVDTLTEAIFIDMFGEPGRRQLHPTHELSLGELTQRRPICYGVLKPGPHDPAGVPLVRIVDLAHGVVTADRLHRISPALDDEFKRSRLRGGEVLLSIQGTIGRVAVCPDWLAGGNISRTIARIDPDDRVETAYLAEWLRQQTSFATTGSTRASLNIGAIRKMLVPIPPAAAQREFARRARAVDQQRERILASERQSTMLAASLQQWAFRGEL